MSKKSPSALRPTTSALSTRYDRDSRIVRSNRPIKPGLFTFSGEPEPSYLPPLWSRFTNPEGNPYFVRNASPRIITEINLSNTKLQDEISEWVDVVNDIISERQIHLPNSAEIFLEPSESSETCSYYIVDHNTRVESWFDETDAEDLELLPSVSDSHMRSALEELYWNHVEHFPSHLPPDADLLIDELTDILIQSRADHLTSFTSTFPYPAPECAQFLDLLKTAREAGRLNSAHTRWSVARLWSMIANHKFNIQFGQERCRLSRDQSILEASPVKPSRQYNVVSRILFKLPDLYTSLFEDLWVDQIAYIHRWRQFVSACQGEWKLSVGLSFAVLVCNLLLLSSRMGSSFIAFLSLVACNISIVSGVSLLFKHHRLENDTAADVAIFLSESRKESSGFQKAAVYYSLPRALVMWALAFSSLQGLVGMSSACSWFAPLMALAFILFGVGFLIITMSKRVWRLFRPQDKSLTASAV